MQYVPVISKTGKPLMPCHPARARELVRKGRAVRRFNRGIFYLRLLDREDGETQEIAALLVLVPLRFHRRQIHAMQSSKGGVRRPYGGTRSLGFKRGSWVKHPRYGVAYVGGTIRGRLSLHSLDTGKRLCQNAKSEDCQFLTYSSWRRKEVAHSSPR